MGAFFMIKSLKIISHNDKQTQVLGEKIAPILGKGRIAFLKGDLGSGKTTFVKGITKYYKCAQQAKSPTFILISTYIGSIDVNHCDFYRITNPEEIFDLALEELLEKGNLIIEWPEVVSKYIPIPDIELFFSVINDTEREIILTFKNNKILDEFKSNE